MTNTVKGTWGALYLLAVALIFAIALGATAHLLLEAGRLGWGLVS